MVEPCTVIIPTKNGGEDFACLLRALAQQSIWNQVELIVVDSGSEDDTVKLAREAGARVITIPPQEFNHGATRDLGVLHAKNEHVVLMVQDALPANPYMLEALVSALSDKQVAGAYCRQVPRPEADVLTKRNLNGWRTGGCEREVRSIPSLPWYEALSPMQRYLFCNFDNVCSAVNKSAWKQEPFGLVEFGEDIAWAERVLKRGHTIIFEPSAIVIHSHNRGLRYEYDRTYICHRSLYRLFRVHLVPSLRSLALSWLASSLFDIVYVARSEKRLQAGLLLVLRVPALNFLSALAQYRAAQDEICGRRVARAGDI